MGKVTRLTGGEGEAQHQRPHLREIPGEAELPHRSVGQDLVTARLGRGEDLGHVSQALRIRKDYLEALESDRAHGLPGRTYGIGFVRTYASYLGLDAPSLVSRYKLATVGLPESAPQVGPAPEAGGFRWGMGWTLSALAVGALLVYATYEVSERPVPQAPNATTSRASARSLTPAIRSRHGTPRASAAQPPPPSSSATIPAGQTFGLQNHDARVILHATAMAHVLVDGPGGKVYINRLLHPGDVYRVPNLVGLSLTTPNGGGVSVELDGRDIGAAGGSGHMVEALSLDPAVIVDRKRTGVPGRSTR